MNADYGVYEPSGRCTMVKKDDCVFEACDEKRNDSQLCVGGPLALYVYKIKHNSKRIWVATYLPSGKMSIE